MYDLKHTPGDGSLIVHPAGTLPPAALASAPAQHLSERYAFIDTRQVIEMMTEEGFVVADSATRRRRDAAAPQLGMHIVDFRHPAAPEMFGTVPRVLFINSHDGSRRASVRAGAFRLACSNGMVVGQTFAHAQVRHAGDSARDLVERMRQLSKASLPMFRQIEKWTRTQLSKAQAIEFAELARELRWPSSQSVPVEALLTVRRDADEAGDLWTVFNRVQEATTRLALEGLSANGRRVTTRPLQEVGANMKYNAELWALAEEYAG